MEGHLGLRSGHRQRPRERQRCGTGRSAEGSIRGCAATLADARHRTRSPPRSGRRNGLIGPLAGLRILELGGIGPGPMAAMLLADMGATVIRVDKVVAGEAAFPVEPRFDVVLRNRRSLALDIRKPQGLALLLKLADTSDGLIEGF